MGTTNALFLPFPELTETADGPDAYNRLANAVEDWAFDRILPAGVTRTLPHVWGTGTTPPAAGTTGLRAGDHYVHTTFGLLIFTANIWRPAQIPVLLNTDSTPGLYVGMYRDNATRGLERWNGTSWVPPTFRPIFQAYATGGAQTNLTGWNDISLAAENFDTHNGHGADLYAYAIPEAGPYALEGMVSFEQSVSGNPARGARITVNGNVLPNAGGVLGSLGDVHCAAVTGRKIWSLATGDVIRLQGWSSATWHTRTDTAAGFTSVLTVERLIGS